MLFHRFKKKCIRVSLHKCHCGGQLQIEPWEGLVVLNWDLHFEYVDTENVNLYVNDCLKWYGLGIGLRAAIMARDPKAKGQATINLFINCLLA